MALYYITKARNVNTGETVKAQDLTGARFELSQKSLAENHAQQLADKMTARTGETWIPIVETYTPTYRRG